MSITEFKSCDHEVRPVCSRVELHKSRPDAAVQYEELPLCDSLVLPRPPGEIVSVTVRIGRRPFAYAIVREALDVSTNFREFACYLEGEELRLVPHYPRSKVTVFVETTSDG